MRNAAALVAGVLLTGCSLLSGSRIDAPYTSANVAFDFQKPVCSDPTAGPADALKVRYLGTGGAYLEWRGEGILLGPAFAHPSMLSTQFFGNIRVDPGIVEAGLREVPSDRVKAIFVGHSHYDHIGDIPAVHERIPDAIVYVNESGRHTLVPHIPDAVSYEHGDWIQAGSAFRVKAVRSDHAHQICRFRFPPCVFAFGKVDRDWTTPWSRHNWKDLQLGTPHAFLIELAGVPFRIYYNDSAVGPSSVARLDATVDLAMITVASFHLAKDYPAALVAKVKPRHVLLTHYEDFFHEYKPERLRFVPLLTNARAARFMSMLAKAMAAQTKPLRPANRFCGVEHEKWSMARPGETLYFVP